MPLEQCREGELRIGVSLGAFVLAVFVLVYWGYPFDGMVIEESWNLYTYPKGEPGAALEVNAADVRQWLSARRGGYNLVRLLLVSAGATPVIVNGLCIASQAINLLLFSILVFKLAGRDRIVSILVAALLYPFASSGHFWQVGLIHHLAITFFFSSLILFLRVGWDREPRGRDVLLYGLPSLACFWLSLTLMEHAILMPVLLLYLALYHANGRGTLLRFRKFYSPAVAFALCYLAISLLFVGVSLSQVHSRLGFMSPTHAGRFAAWAASAHIPPLVMTGLVLGTNAILFFSAAAFANSIGYLAYPAATVLPHASMLVGEAAGWAVGWGLVALLGATGLYLSSKRAAPGGGRPAASCGFLVTVGLLWTLLAYVPLSFSFAYPRVVGQSADRINALAMFGVSLCWGAVIGHVLTGLAVKRPAVRVAAFAGCFLAIAMLMGNLRVQRDYWVEAYDKERRFVLDALTILARERAGGRSPLIILDREHKPEPVRTRLARALQQPGAAEKFLEVAKVILARHFTEAGEIEVTSFHLQGVPLFGGVASGASYVFNHYARQLSMAPVLVYKIDDGATLREDADQVVIAYERQPAVSYSKRDYHPLVLNLDESFFRFRGSPTYQMRESPSLNGSR